MSLAIDREVTRFLAAGRKPIPIKVECSGLQIVGIVNDAQNRAASAGDHPSLHHLVIDVDRPVGSHAQVHAVIGRDRGCPLRTEDVEGRTRLWR